MESPLHSLSNELAALAAKVAPSVVTVHGRRRTPSSGVHWQKDLIVTAEHTLRRDENVMLTLPNGEEIEAAFVGRDPGTDLAVLKVDGLGTPVLDVRSANSPRVGDLAMVIGRSPNSGPNASMGIISAVSGPWRTWRGGSLDLYVRLDATVFPGSSGGAVLDFAGRTVGIATSALSRVAGLAVPTATVNRVLGILLDKGRIPQGYLGVGLHPVPMPDSFQKKFGLKQAQGIMVLNVEPAGPAESGGILVGDIVFNIDGKATEQVDDLQAYLAGERVGRSIAVKVIRGGELKEVAVVVGDRLQRSAP